ncbi:1-acyl-sn-glycerol-3-phosphate acyltransferase [Actinomycetospora endophytica]|uniref:1-acyl-sn-glycerol-3-phosphate acyltransferase n=1 Tax=Actinomycetospora endophytica TaxID=2291215 RepID=A0ABS8PF37_9PSEU|nr:lysophospholipid acyltransferase family protein [Actinomycetospora endophytica]MCD2196881.1 1-acyl-sn-glycerol-3-phosphate acyltransferase [Actinomycetospora endophytica]
MSSQPDDATDAGSQPSIPVAKASDHPEPRAHPRVRRIAQGHDKRPPGRAMRLWRKLAIWLLYPRLDRGFGYGFAIDLLWPVLMAVARWDFRGGRHVPARGGVLLAVNHLSHVDPIVLVAYCMAQGRVPRFLAMSELWDMKIVGAPLRGGRHIPVDRRASGIEAYRAAVEGVKRGECIVVYPEGGFPDHSDGWPRKAHTGVARMALATGAPVIPVGQWGSNQLLPPTAKVGTLVPRATLHVLAGEPVDLSDLVGKQGRRSALQEATDRIMDRVTERLGELRGEVPPPMEERVSD